MGYCCVINAIFGIPGEILKVMPLSQEQKMHIMEQSKLLIQTVNQELEKFDAFQIVVLSVLTVLVIQYGYKFTMWIKENLNFENIKTQGFRIAASLIPQVKAHIEKELHKMEEDCVKKYSDIRRGVALTKLPIDGKS
jgi:hypothetical protein